jgi:hypothetical protein
MTTITIEVDEETMDAAAAKAFIEEKGKTVVNIRFDSALLDRVDADARRLGINRTAWLHVAANSMLDRAK